MGASRWRPRRSPRVIRAFVGPLAGVQLGLPVLHIFEDKVREQVDPAVYEERIGFVELAVDSDAVRAAMKKLQRRGARGQSAAQPTPERQASAMPEPFTILDRGPRSPRGRGLGPVDGRVYAGGEAGQVYRCRSTARSSRWPTRAADPRRRGRRRRPRLRLRLRAVAEVRARRSSRRQCRRLLVGGRGAADDRAQLLLPSTRPATST